jgi:hypothetical protein
MSNKLRIIEAEAVARNVLKDKGVSSLPVCPFSIAESKGITVEPEDSDNFTVPGLLLKVGNMFGIKYATYLKNDGFIRFTISHELGHYFLPGHPEQLFHGKDGVHKSRSGFVSEDPYEIQADHFAKELLMPESLFSDAVLEAGVGFPAIEYLANKCKTSITATSIRYAQFAEYPIAIIMSEGNKVDWCFMSETLKNVKGISGIKKGSLLPLESTTAQFNKNHENISKARQDQGWTMLHHWIDGAPNFEMKEDVVGLGSYSKTLTVLFSEEIIEEAEEDDGLEIGNENKGWKWC